MELHFLTNSNPNLQRKMRFFADYFVHANEFLGKLPGLPFDNPVSLVNKIIFQIENNIEHAPRYMENHIQQLMEFFGVFLEKQYPSFIPVKNGIIEYEKCKKKRKCTSSMVKN